jgi:hypothetical protein
VSDLLESCKALVRLDEDNALVPHGLGGHGRSCLKWCIEEIERLRNVETAARNVADTLNGGFVRCETCGDQETTTDIDFAAELYAALGMETKF